MLRYILTSIYLSFSLIYAQLPAVCVSNASQIINIPNAVSITAVNPAPNTLTPTIINPNSSSSAISIPAAVATATGANETYTVTYINGTTQTIQLGNPPIAPVLKYNLNCNAGTLNITPTNLTTGATVTLINPPAGLTVDPTSGVVTLPTTGIGSFSAVQTIENFAGIAGCNSTSTAIISTNFNFLAGDNVQICSGENIGVGSIFTNYTGAPNDLVINGNIITLTPPGTFNPSTIPTPPPLPSNGSPVQIQTVNWPVVVTYNGCTFTQNATINVTQMNTNLADDLRIANTEIDDLDDLLVFAPVDPTQIIDRLTIENSNPDTNPGSSVSFSQPTALTEPYGMSIGTNKTGTAPALVVPITTAFNNRNKTVRIRNTLTNPILVPPVCAATPLFRDINITFTKPAVAEVQIDAVTPDFQTDFPCSDYPMTLTVNGAENDTRYGMLDNRGNPIPLVRQGANQLELAAMPAPGVVLTNLVSSTINGLRTINRVMYQAINLLDADAVKYDHKIICGWQADANNPYRYDPATVGVIPMNANALLTNPVTFNNASLSGVDYDPQSNTYPFVYSAGINTATSQPHVIFYDLNRPDGLNPAGWVNLDSTTPEQIAAGLGGILYLSNLQLEPNYGNIEFNRIRRVQFQYQENITIFGETTVPPTGVSGTPFNIPTNLNITCNLPAPPNRIAFYNLYYGSRRVPEPPRIQLNANPLELCPGLTSSLTSILDNNTNYASSATDPNYSYRNAFSMLLNIGNTTEPTSNNPNGTPFDANTLSDPTDPLSAPIYNSNELKIKYRYNYILTDNASQCTANQGFTIGVDQTCLDSMFNAKNPINTCTGNLSMNDILNISPEGLAVLDNITIIESANAPTLTGTAFPVQALNSPIINLPTNAIADEKYPLILSIKDQTGVTYEIPEIGGTPIIVTALQQQFADFSYSPNLINTDSFFPAILQPLFDPNQFTAGGTFTSPTLAATALDAFTGNINKQELFQGLQITDIAQLKPNLITYTTPNQCASVTQPLTVEVATKVYTGMSPNGDGKNEVLWIDNANFYPNLTLEVFDQNGNRVFYQKGYNNTWGGILQTAEKFGMTVPNQLLKPGTYYYSLFKAKGIPLEKGVLFIRY